MTLLSMTRTLFGAPTRFVVFALVLVATPIAACGGDAPPAEAAPRVIPAGPPARDSMSAASLVGISPEEIVLALPYSVGRMNRAPTPGQAQRTIEEVLLLSGEGFDRFVVTFRDDAPSFPGYTIEYQDEPSSACGDESGAADFDSDAAAHLSLTIRAVRGHEDDGTNTSGPNEIPGGSEHVSAVHKTCDFEGVAAWVFDLSAQHPYRILELQNPVRFVIDVQHPFTPIDESAADSAGN